MARALQCERVLNGPSRSSIAPGVTARDTADSDVGAADGAGVLPGIGTAIAGGTLAAILSSAAAGAATAGVAGTLIGLGIPEDEAKYYDQEFRAGRIVVTVDAGSRFQEAQAILGRNRGYDMLSARDRTQPGATVGGMTEEEARQDAVLANEGGLVDKRDRDTRPRPR